MAGRRARKDNNRVGKFCISTIVIVFGAVMTVQIIRVYQKDQIYIAKQAQLEKQLAEEQARQGELAEFENYTKSQEYIEDIAQTKLGLAYEDEIIFKEIQQ